MSPLRCKSYCLFKVCALGPIHGSHLTVQRGHKRERTSQVKIETTKKKRKEKVRASYNGFPSLLVCSFTFNFDTKSEESFLVPNSCFHILACVQLETSKYIVFYLCI